MEEHKGFMTTSCCPAWMELVDKHLPAMKSRVSGASSPMAYAAEEDIDKHPDHKRVFIGPCLAKKVEASKIGGIDAVITFSELAALFIARDIDVRELVPTPMGDDAAYKDCRGFASSQGVAHAVLGRLDGSEEPVVFPVDGIDRKTVRAMRIWEKRPVDADLVEVMCCEGGCLAGPGVVVNPKVALRLRQGTNAAKAGSVPLRGKS
jgi:iron only hydrogenase large subunit-like protein